MGETNVHVAIFAKTPRKGEVKTRLIPELGAAGALKAASWVQNQEPGLYSMQDVLGLTS